MASSLGEVWREADCDICPTLANELTVGTVASAYLILTAMVMRVATVATAKRAPTINNSLNFVGVQKLGAALRRDCSSISDDTTKGEALAAESTTEKGKCFSLMLFLHNATIISWTNIDINVLLILMH